MSDLATAILDPVLKKRAGISIGLVQSWEEIAGPGWKPPDAVPPAIRIGDYELRVRDLPFDLVASLDGDISFEPDYFDFLLTKQQPTHWVASRASLSR